MGFRISWVGFHGLPKSDVLQIISGIDSGTLDEANEAPFSIAEIPGEWCILFSNDFEYASAETLKSLSARGALVACQVHEGVMFSAAYGYERSELKWSLTHNSDNGVRDLGVSGSPPREFAEIRDRLSKAQEDEGGDNADVDYFFDIPVETAEALCTYRHDRWKFDWGQPTFTVVNVR